jgi:hypothetical protein
VIGYVNKKEEGVKGDGGIGNRHHPWDVMYT